MNSLNQSRLNDDQVAPVSFLAGTVTACVVVAVIAMVMPSPSAGPDPRGLDALFRNLRGPLLHTILQWTGVCVALLTAVCALSHFTLRRDLATIAVGAAVVFAGLIDAFHTLVWLRFFSDIADDASFGPFTWALSRIFHAMIVALGAGPFTTRGSEQWLNHKSGSGLLIAACAVMALGTFSIIHVCARVDSLPEALAPDGHIPRPWDAFALMIYLLAGGILLPRFYRQRPSLFAYGLLLSLIPHIAGETIVAFGSRAEFDSAFLAGQGLKLIGYAVPLAGLLVDYSRVYHAEGILQATEEKLRLAREIQQGFIPSESPDVPVYEFTGVCIPTDAVGGDFFDYIPMADDHLCIVIADVSGHDLGASILMSQARAYLRAEAAYTSDPAALLTRVNRFLCNDVRDRRFVSMCCLALDPTTDTISYSSAGHPAYIVSETGEYRELPATGPILGVIDMEMLPGTAFHLGESELLVLITDGWAEATSPRGDMLGNQRVFAELTRSRQATLADRLANLQKAIARHRDDRPADDDLTAVLIRHKQPAAAPVPV